MLYHVHVYFPIKMMEVDVEARDEEDARTQALAIDWTSDESKKRMVGSDCKRIALTWDENGIIRDTKGHEN